MKTPNDFIDEFFSNYENEIENIENDYEFKNIEDGGFEFLDNAMLYIHRNVNKLISDAINSQV